MTDLCACSDRGLAELTPHERNEMQTLLDFCHVSTYTNTHAHTHTSSDHTHQ
jgi:type III secretory pathway lipoprotein EscJ